QTIHNLASSTINDSEEWIKEARQNYKVNHGSQSFTNSKVSNQLKEIESIKEGYFPDSQEIIDSSKIALSLADEAYKNKNNITGDFWLKSAAQLADLAIGFIPIASVFDDLHSVIVGKSLFERRELSTEERAIAAVGVVTLGLGSEIVKASAVLEIAGKAIVAYGAKKGVDLVFKHGKKVIAAAIKYGFDSSKDLGHYARTMRYANVKNFDGFLAQTARNKLGKPIVFTSNKAIEHFQKHGPDIMSSMYKNSYNLKDYVLDAQHVIKEGQYVKEANAYIQLIGGGGKNSLAKKQTKDGVSKYAFVGVDKEHTRITTFHIKSVKELKKKYPLLGIE
ncbi:MAG: hypothetical protein KDD40_07220, partial [Bdellovibrionales bacterium]|nr:hypothetical protein [Bdellovibrionales bacterium]